MRIGEILALGWRDVDLDRRTISVRRTLTRDANARLKIGDIPKTRASRRLIPIGVATANALRTQRARQAERHLKLGSHWNDSGLVFDRGNGQPIEPSVVRHAFEVVLRKNPEYPEITLHGMRHTMATMMLAEGVNPKVVQERLGHASIQMTLDRYSHVTLNMQEDAAALLDALLNEDSRPKRGQELG
jgi:integrase